MRARFFDPTFDPLSESIEKLIEVAWRQSKSKPSCVGKQAIGRQALSSTCPGKQAGERRQARMVLL